MARHSPTRWQPFIAKPEQASAELLEAQHELADFRCRARAIRDRHEPGAEARKKPE